MKSANPLPGSWITPDWPAPSNIRAVTTTRHNGHSLPPYGRFNLAMHVGDTEERVARNRQELKKILGIPDNPLWLQQTHSENVVCATTYTGNEAADGSYTDQQGVVCALLTADCIPLLFCNRSGTRVAAIHAGWRGLSQGITRHLTAIFDPEGDEILAWIGPHIRAQHYEVGVEVKQALTAAIGSRAETAFVRTRPGHWLADMASLARFALENSGIRYIYDCGRCTYSDGDDFYSYRRENTTGRMASLIWIAEQARGG